MQDIYFTVRKLVYNFHEDARFLLQIFHLIQDTLRVVLLTDLQDRGALFLNPTIQDTLRVVLLQDRGALFLSPTIQDTLRVVLLTDLQIEASYS